LQHRGQESAGIATSDGKRINVYKDMGLVSQVFDETTLNTLTGHLAVGHCRYSTTGASHWANAQPTLGATSTGTVALAHNGNLTNTAELNAMILERNGGQLTGEMKQGNTSDTALVTHCWRAKRARPSNRPPSSCCPRSRAASASSSWTRAPSTQPATPTASVRLCLGRLERGWVVASEQSALATVGASFIREIEPGEFIAIDEQGVRSQRFAEPTPAGCVFEYVYLARPDAAIAGRSVYESRVEMGRQLARENTQEADIVIPVPESGTPAAVGYAEESGIPFAHGFVKNSYVGRTFIQPSQTLRQLGIRLKLNALESVIRGKRVVVVDDSIVRGNTQRAIVRMLREAGAATVHVKISSPPVQWPCFYGIDFASRAELIANGATIEEISQAIGADSLAYISEDGMIDATQQPANGSAPPASPASTPLSSRARTNWARTCWSARTSAACRPAQQAALRPPPVTPPRKPPSNRPPPHRVRSIPVTEDPAEKPGATGCDPGPDAEFENLLTDADRVPDLHHDAATVGADKKESYDFRFLHC
jgi:amidophosphoribosyltransferase